MSGTAGRSKPTGPISGGTSGSGSARSRTRTRRRSGWPQIRLQLLDLLPVPLGEHADRAHTDHDLAGWADGYANFYPTPARLMSTSATTRPRRGLRAELMDRRLIVKISLPCRASPPRDAMVISGAGGYIAGSGSFPGCVDNVSGLAGVIGSADKRCDVDGARITVQNCYHVCAIGIMAFSYGRQAFAASAMSIERDIKHRECGGHYRRRGSNRTRCQGGGAECERCTQCAYHDG
jgi:hypothetical protein